MKKATIQLLTVALVMFGLFVVGAMTIKAHAEDYKPQQKVHKHKRHKKAALKVTVQNPPSPVILAPSGPMFFRQPRIEHTSFPYVVAQAPVNLGLAPFRAVFEPTVQPYPTYIWHEPFKWPY